MDLVVHSSMVPKKAAWCQRRLSMGGDLPWKLLEICQWGWGAEKLPCVCMGGGGSGGDGVRQE